MPAGRADRDLQKRLVETLAPESAKDYDVYFGTVARLYLGEGADWTMRETRRALSNLRADGFTPSFTGRDEHFAPFLAQACLLAALFAGNAGADADVYRGLRAYVRYWLEGMARPGHDLSFWRSAVHSGMDSQTERCGEAGSDFSEGADLNAYLFRECAAMARIAEARGEADDAEYFRDQASRKKRAIASLWDEGDGIFYDRHAVTGQPVRVKSLSGCMPMWAGACEYGQAERLAYDHLLNPAEFYRAFPFPALSADEPGYMPETLPGDEGECWRATTHIQTNYMMAQALTRYGFSDLAALVAYRTESVVKRAGEWRCYTTEDGSGCAPEGGWAVLSYFLRDEAARRFFLNDDRLTRERLRAQMPYFR